MGKKEPDPQITTVLAQAYACLRSGELDRAEQLVAETLNDHPEDDRVCLMRAKTLFQRGRFRDTERYCKETGRERPNAASFGYLRARALLQLSELKEANALIDQLLQEHPDDGQLKYAKCTALYRLGSFQEAADLAGQGLESSPEDTRFATMGCRALLRMGDFLKALALAEAAFQDTKSEEQLFRIRCRCLLELGLGKALRDLLVAETRVAEGGALASLSTYVKALESTGDWDEIVRVVEMYQRQKANIELSVRISLMIAYQFLGRDSDGKAVFQSLGDHWQAAKPRDLSEAFRNAEQFGPSELPNSAIPSLVLDRLWRLANREQWNKEDWLAEIRWGWGAQHLLYWTYLTDHGRRNDLQRLLIQPDFSEIQEAMGGGRSVLLVGAHLGPFAAGSLSIARANIPTAFVSVLQIPPECHAGSVYTLNFNRPAMSALRDLRSAMRAGHAIFVPGDADRGLALGDTGYRIGIFGRDVEVPSFSPRLAFQHKLVSFWCQPSFVGDRIATTIVRLPTAESGESKEDFAAKWLKAYFDIYIHSLSGHPRNLLLRNGPVWRACLPAARRDTSTARRLPVEIGIPDVAAT